MNESLQEHLQGPRISLLELVGGYSACLVLAALALGLAAVILRKQRFSIFSACAVVGIAFAGLGATFWNLSQDNMMLIGGHAGIDPYAWLGDFGYSCASAGAVLPACGIAMILVGLAFLFQKRELKNVE